MLIITGSIAYDYIMNFPGAFGDHILPEHVHHVNLSFIADNFAKKRGGTAGNVSYTLNLLHTPHKTFSYVGKDFANYEEELKAIGYSLDGIKRDDILLTATGFALTDKAGNQIWGYYYGAAEKNDSLDLTEIIVKDSLVLIGPQGARGSLSLVRQCIKQSIPYMFDPGFILTEVSNADLALSLTHATYIIGNEYEMVLMKQRLQDWHSITREKICITTLAEKGAYIQTPNASYTIAPVSDIQLVETAGAGDAWRAGFLAGLIRAYDLPTCGQMGCVAGSFAVEAYGTQEHIFSLKDFSKRYQQTYNQSLILS